MYKLYVHSSLHILITIQFFKNICGFLITIEVYKRYSWYLIITINKVYFLETEHEFFKYKI